VAIKTTPDIQTPTKFPVLGSDFTCDCWESYFIDPTPVLRRFLHTFGKFEVKCRCLLESNLPTLLLVRVENKFCLLVTRFEDTYSFFQTKDCHQSDSKTNWIADHQASLVLRIRLENGEIPQVLDRYNSDNYFRDLTEFVVDQHAHSSFVTTIHPAPTPSPDWVVSNGVAMARDAKCAQRRERRANNKELRRQGLKIKKVQLPIRYRGLTTQEYHELRLREQEEFTLEFEQRGMSMLPQAVKEYLKYGTGHEWWENLHVWSIDRPAFALKSLDKLNNFLRSLGCPFPLSIRPGKVKVIIAAREKYNLARSIQQSAAKSRVLVKGKGLVPISAMANYETDNKRDRELANRRGWADMDDDDLGDLPVF